MCRIPPLAVVHIYDLHLFSRQNAGLLQQVAVDGHAADVVDICLGNGRRCSFALNIVIKLRFSFPQTDRIRLSISRVFSKADSHRGQGRPARQDGGDLLEGISVHNAYIVDSASFSASISSGWPFPARPRTAPLRTRRRYIFGLLQGPAEHGRPLSLRLVQVDVAELMARRPLPVRWEIPRCPPAYEGRAPFF
jgi:hypothetical protein